MTRAQQQQQTARRLMLEDAIAVIPAHVLADILPDALRKAGIDPDALEQIGNRIGRIPGEIAREYDQ